MTSSFNDLSTEHQRHILQLMRKEFVDEYFQKFSEELKASEPGTKPFEKLLEVCPQLFTGCLARAIPAHQVTMRLLEKTMPGITEQNAGEYHALIELEKKIEELPLPILSEAIAVQFETYVKARMGKVFDSRVVNTPESLGKRESFVPALLKALSYLDKMGHNNMSLAELEAFSQAKKRRTLSEAQAGDDETTIARKKRFKALCDDGTDPTNVILPNPEAARRKLVDLIGQGLDVAEGIFSEDIPENSTQAEMIVRLIDKHLQKFEEKFTGPAKG